MLFTIIASREQAAHRADTARCSEPRVLKDRMLHLLLLAHGQAATYSSTVSS